MSAPTWRPPGSVVHQRFGSHEPPATLLGVSVLGYPGQLFEVEAGGGPSLAEKKFWHGCRIRPVSFV